MRRPTFTRQHSSNPELLLPTTTPQNDSPNTAASSDSVYASYDSVHGTHVIDIGDGVGVELVALVYPKIFTWWSTIIEFLAIHSSVMGPLADSFEVKNLPPLVIIAFEALFFLDIIFQGYCICRPTQQPITCRQFFALMLHNPKIIVEILPFIFFGTKYKNWVRIVRASKVKRLMEKFENLGYLRDYYYIKVLKLLVIHYLCIHLIGCLFHLLAKTDISKAKENWTSSVQVNGLNFTRLETADKYIVSIYFATATLSTIGFGDIHPVNPTDMLAFVFLHTCGLIAWTYLGVKLTTIFSRAQTVPVQTT